MSETTSSPESPRISRQQVVEGFRKFVQRGVKNPDDLDDSDPEVRAALEPYFEWNKQEDAATQEIGTTEARLKYNLSASTLYLDAGFSHPDFLDEVANDWLGGNDLPAAEEAGLTEIAEQIRDKINEINNRLNR